MNASLAVMPLVIGLSWQPLTAILILFVFIAFFVVLLAMASRYKKIAPNEVGIFYGRRYAFKDAEGRAQSRGGRVVAGGGSLLWPIVERLQVMSTAVTQVVIDEHDIPNKDNVKISAKGVATFKIDNTTHESLANAAAAFLGKTDAALAEIIRNIIQGHLRSIIGKLDINEILRDRDTFNRRVVEESTDELRRLGIQIITLVIQEVNDEHGYINALGRRAVAEAIRDADIKTAEAESESKKKVSDAGRTAEITVAQNDVMVAQAQRDRDVQKAQFKVLADTERAKAEKAFDIQLADQDKMLRVRQAERDAAATEAQTHVQEMEAARKQQELIATVVRPAEAAREQTVIEAEARKRVTELTAEAAKAKQVTEAEGVKLARIMEGEGEGAKTRAIMLAQADGEAAKTRQALLAQAEGQAAMRGKVLLAEAEGEAAKKGLVLKAEAEGTQKLAEALAKMTSDAKLILILDRLPHLFQEGGDAMAKVASAVFSSVAAPLGNIDELRIIDMGGNGKGLDHLSTLVPQTVFKTLALMQAEGIDVRKLMDKLGVNVEQVVDMLGQASSRTARPHEAPPAESHEAAPSNP